MDSTYKDFPYIFTSKGLVARFPFDRCPESTYINLQNLEVRQENALSSRLGRAPVTYDGVSNYPLADTNIHTLGYMRGLGGLIFRYAGANQNLYRRVTVTGGGFSLIGVPAFYKAFGYGLSGNRFSMAQYRPSFNANPWIFFADSGAMLKDSGLLDPVEQWGIFAPFAVPYTTFMDSPSNPVFVNDLIIETFFANTGFLLTNCTFNSIIPNANTTLTSAISFGGFGNATVASSTGVVPYAVLNVGNGANQETIFNGPLLPVTVNGNFTKTHPVGAAVTSSQMLLNLVGILPARIQKSVVLNLNISGTASDASDYITFFVQSGSANVVGGTAVIKFDVGDGSFTDYYSGTATIPATGIPVKIQRSAFTAFGNAGNGGNTWANVAAFRIEITPPGGISVGTFSISALSISGLGGPDVTAGGAVPYDYRITFFNINTGTESNPTVPWISSLYVSPQNTPVGINWFFSFNSNLDPQVTHVRIYRRGGTLTAGWFFVAQVPVALQGYIDSSTDLDIASNNLLSITNDPPVTTSLKVPVDTTMQNAVNGFNVNTVTPASMANIFPNQVLTVDVGSQQETVIVQSITATTFTAFFQTGHASGTAISANTRVGTPMNLAACAFEQMWLAGDPNNPNRLYYSNPQAPENFPVSNYIEIGVPSDPIMAVVVLRGQLFVFTTQRVYRVVVYPGIVPTAYPTSSRHGLISSWAWCIEEAQIWYRSADGIYVFNGDTSQYASEPVEWILAKKEPNLGPVPTDLISLSPLNLNTQNILMAYNKNELFYSYLGTGNIQVRMIFETLNKRWRNDTGDYLAMNNEEDTQTLVVARQNGMIYYDRVGDVDAEGANPSIPIPIALETPALDQGAPKNNKVYNEFTLDLDPNGQTLQAILAFDRGRSTENLTLPFNIPVVTGRQQFQFKVATGQGVLAKTVSLLVSGGVSSVVHLYEWHIKAAVDAELRQSYDSWWNNDGTAEYKIMKQGYFEYIAADAAGLLANVYFDGSSVPSFSFTLAQSVPQASPYQGQTRTVKLVRFPAWKYKTRRIVITSASDFQLFGASFIEMKPVTTGKGYAKVPFGEISAQGSI